MPGQFDKETSIQNFEWHRQRALREKQSPNSVSANRLQYNINAIEKKHGAKAARELIREVTSKNRNKRTQYFT